MAEIMTTSAEELVSILQLITGISFVIGALATLLAIFYFRRSRQGAYWRKRRQSGDRGLRFAFIAVVFLGLGAAFCGITLSVDYVETGDISAPLANAPSQTTAPSETPSPNATPSVTATPAPTNADSSVEITTDISPATEPPSPSAEPILDATAVSAAVVPIETFMNIRAIDDAISDDWQAIQPSITFTAGVQRLYVFFDYANVPADLAWQQILLRDGEVIQQVRQVWGVLRPQGNWFIFFGDSAGFAAGSYDVQLTAGDGRTILATESFVILPE